MPLQKIQFRPGINRESTSLANEGGWYAGDKIRFRSGQPEKIGGWTFLGMEHFLGVCRHLVEWESLSQYTLLGVGTHLKYYILSNQTYYDITPLRLTLSPLSSNPIQTVYTLLNADISSSVTSIPVVSAAAFALVTPIVISINLEQIYVGGASGNTLTGCIRGYNNTTPTTHANTAVVSSTWLIVHCVANGATMGDYVTISGATAFDTYTTTVLNNNFEVKARSTDYIAIESGMASTSATSGGGAVVKAEFEIHTGADTNTSGSGWGASTWVGLVASAGQSMLNGALNATATSIVLDSTSTFSASGYILIESELIQYTSKNGDGVTLNGCTRSTINATTHGDGIFVQQVIYASPTRPWSSAATTDINVPLRLWDADVFGQDLVFNVTNNAVYYWTASSGLSSAGAVTARGVNIVNLPSIDTDAPTVATCVIVADERCIIVFGTNDPSATSPDAQDPLFIRWCDQENPLVWVPAPTNTAGFQRLSHGSHIVTAEKTRQEILVWTDNALYSMRFLGPPYTFGFNILATDITIVALNAMITANGITFWMGLDKFYAYSGRVDTMPCSIKQYIFDDINMAQAAQIYAGSNERFNEVWWFYCSTNAIQNDRYVVYNYMEQTWYYGTLSRTAWFDSHVRQYPLAAAPAGHLLYHEYGLDDATDPSAPVPFESFVESSDFDLGDGDKFTFVSRVLPDMDFIGSENQYPVVNFSVSVRDFSGRGTFKKTTDSPVNATQQTIQIYNYTDQAFIRLRGRQVALKISSSDTLGVMWQLGTPRFQIREDGRRS